MQEQPLEQKAYHLAQLNAQRLSVLEARSEERYKSLSKQIRNTEEGIAKRDMEFLRLKSSVEELIFCSVNTDNIEKINETLYNLEEELNRVRTRAEEIARNAL